MITKEWICGFINGEGCFTFGRTTPVFTMTLSIKDLEILEKIKKFLDIGSVNIAKKDFSYTYYVTGVERCLKLIELFDGHINGDKLIDFENWKLGIKFLQSIPKGEIHSKQDREFINKLKPRQNKERILYKKYQCHIKNTKICIRCKYKFAINSSAQKLCNDCRPFVDQFRKNKRIEKGLCQNCGEIRENKRWKSCLKCRIKGREQYKNKKII